MTTSNAVSTLARVFIVARKELLYAWRDPDVMLYAVLLPLVISPILFIAANDFAFWSLGRLERINTNVHLQQVPDARYDVVKKGIQELPRVTLVHSDDPIADLKSGKIDLYVTFEDQAGVRINVAYGKILNQPALAALGTIKRAREEYVRSLAKEAGIDPRKLSVFTVSYVDVAPSAKRQEIVPLEELGGLPMAVLVVAFLVWIHIGISTVAPALVMFAEEREKKTLETTLLLPVERMVLIGGKFLATWSMGLFAGLMYAIGICLTILVIAASLAGHHEGALAGVLPNVLGAARHEPESYLLLVAVILVSTALCAAFYLMCTARAGTFKEAQALISMPSASCALIPLLALLPGVELNWITCFVPVLNLFLVLKRGEPDLLLSSAAFLSALILTGIALYSTSRLLSKETGQAR